MSINKILAFAGSNSSTSINYQLVIYTCSLIEDFNVNLLNMSKMPFPMYSADTEKRDGFKNALVELHKEIRACDALIISVNEHNGNPSAYFKNVIDWLSRLDIEFLEGKKIFLMSTSPGRRGGVGSLEVVNALFTKLGAQIVQIFSLPSFNHNFSKESGAITDEELRIEHKTKLDLFLKAIE